MYIYVLYIYDIYHDISVALSHSVSVMRDSLDSNHKHWQKSTRQQKAKWNCDIQCWKMFHFSFKKKSRRMNKKGQFRSCQLLFFSCLFFDFLLSLRIEADFLLNQHRNDFSLDQTKELTKDGQRKVRLGEIWANLWWLSFFWGNLGVV